MLRRYGQGLLALAMVFGTLPALAQANFETLNLSPGFGQKSATGYTGGSYSLPSIANRDRNGNPCLGYGEQAPDFVMNLQGDIPQLSIAVNSGGQDTTLVIRGPGNFTLCGDDTVQDSNWQAGKYEIWVGTIEPNQNWNYSLTVRE